MFESFWEVVGLERGPLSLVNTSEKLLEWKSSRSGSRKTEINGRGDPLRWPRDKLYTQKLTLTSPTSGGRSVGIVRLQAKARVFRFMLEKSRRWGEIEWELMLGQLSRTSDIDVPSGSNRGP
jgi:hypothetical protein